MVNLNIKFSDEEKSILQRFGGNYYEILSLIDGESYILNEYGDYSYNDCFKPTDNTYFMKQKYEKAVPYRVIKFSSYYLMETIDERGVWYKGRKDAIGNWEYECYSDSLQEAFESL